MGNISKFCRKLCQDSGEVEDGPQFQKSHVPPKIFPELPPYVPTQEQREIKEKDKPSTSTLYSSINNREEKPALVQVSLSDPVEQEEAKQELASKEEQEKFLHSSEYEAYTVETDPSALISLAQKASQLQLSKEAGNLYEKVLSIIEKHKYDYDQENIEALKLFVHSQLFNIAIVTNNSSAIEEEYQECLKIYEQMPDEAVVEDKLNQLNTLALFFRKNKSMEKAIKYGKEACDVINKYFTNFEERKFLVQNNLASLYYENGQTKEGNQCIDKIMRECPDELKKVKILAQKNKEFYQRRSQSV